MLVECVWIYEGVPKQQLFLSKSNTMRVANFATLIVFNAVGCLLLFHRLGVNGYVGRLSKLLLKQPFYNGGGFVSLS